MKFFKKALTFMLAAAMLSSAALFTACNKTDTNKDVYRVGICQLVTHDALDAATNGFIEALKEELGEENVIFDVQNAANDNAVCTTIVNNFVSNNVDLIMANATPALQAAAGATTTIPVLGTSVTEYGVALNIENFNGTVGGNISGTSDLAPLSDQAQMLIDLFPEAQNVGIIYCSAEANSAYQVKVIDEYLTAAGIKCTPYSFSDSNDIAVVTEKAASESDVIYIPTDNTAASCTEIINNICLPKKVPIIAGEEGVCKVCGTYSLTISYTEIGRATGKMAAKILKGEADISTMPIEYDTNPVKKYNAECCEILGLTPPEGFIAVDLAEENVEAE